MNKKQANSKQSNIYFQHTKQVQYTIVSPWDSVKTKKKSETCGDN